MDRHGLRLRPGAWPGACGRGTCASAAGAGLGPASGRTVLRGKSDAVRRLCGNLQVYISKARNLLGWLPPVSVDEGLRRAVGTGDGLPRFARNDEKGGSQ